MFSGHHNIHIHMKKCYHIERFPTRIHLITLNDFLCQQFEKGEPNKCCPILIEGIIKVSTFHKFKSNQSNVFQCQLDNLLLKNSHVNFSRNIPLLLSKSFSPPETCQLAQFARGQPSLKFPGAMSKCMSNEHEQVNLYSIFFTCISPPRMSSSRMKYAFSKLKIMSSSHTDPKYLSSTSTYL